jgi:hypothetical protein
MAAVNDSEMPPSDFSIGQRVVDRDDDDPDVAVVVNTPAKTAEEWEIAPGKTLAADNPEYDDSAPVVCVVFIDDLEQFDDEWQSRSEPYPLADIAESDVKFYAFPESRLEPVDGASAVEMPKSTDENAAESSPTVEAPEEGAPGDQGAPAAGAADATDAEEAEPPAPSLSPEAEALRERLETGGMTVSVTDEGDLSAEKLGETYVVRPGTVVSGDGAMRDRLEEIVQQFES